MVDNKDRIEGFEADTELEAGQKLVKQTLDFEKARVVFMAKRKRNSRLLLLGVLFLSFLVIAAYTLSSISNVRSIKISGNSFLSDKYIAELVGIDADSKYMFIVPILKESKASGSPLIKEVRVLKRKNNSIVINVTENKIVGYQYESSMQLVLGDGSLLPFESRYVKNLALLPMFMGLEQEKLLRVAVEMAKLETDILVRISEVRDYALSYDNDMVKFVMEDGYTIYSSVAGIEMLNQYLGILKNTSSKYRCILMDRVNNVAILRDCAELEALYRDTKDPVVDEEQPEDAAANQSTADGQLQQNN